MNVNAEAIFMNSIPFIYSTSGGRVAVQTGKLIDDSAVTPFSSLEYNTLSNIPRRQGISREFTNSGMV